MRAFGASIAPDGGADFRVWAPHADSVSVSGDFNDWEESSHPLERCDRGFWSGHIDRLRHEDEYKFVISFEGNTYWKNDPAAYSVTNSVGNSVLFDHSTFDWGTENFQMPPANELVIYEMHLGTFHRGDDENSVGTFADALDRLDHLEHLGINCIELMPVAEFAGDQSWGYNPAFPYAIESDYGGPDGLKHFVRTCHERGFAVIMDVVYNHFGPSDLDMWRFDGWSENEKGGIFFYNDWRATTPWGDTRPDYGREEVREFIKENALMWLRDYHVDGLRFDMTFYMRSVDDAVEIPDGWTLVQWITDEVRQEFPQALTIAEDLRSNDWITKPTADGGAGFHAQWDERFVHPVRKALVAKEDVHRDLQSVIDSLIFAYNGEPFQRVVYTESHDEVANGKSRVPTEVDEYDQEGFWAQKRSLLGACLTLSAPGIPMIFQGQEFLETGFFEDHYEMSWEKGKRHSGFVDAFRRLIHLRLNRTESPSYGLSTHHLNVTHVDFTDGVVAFTRGEPGNGQVFIVMNWHQSPWDFYELPAPRSESWRLVFRADSPLHGEHFGQDVSWNEPDFFRTQEDHPRCRISLGPYDVLIFSEA